MHTCLNRDALDLFLEKADMSIFYESTYLIEVLTEKGMLWVWGWNSMEGMYCLLGPLSAVIT